MSDLPLAGSSLHASGDPGIPTPPNPGRLPPPKLPPGPDPGGEPAPDPPEPDPDPPFDEPPDPASVPDRSTDPGVRIGRAP